jgi:mono/diheme cytochrome c family protein
MSRHARRWRRVVWRSVAATLAALALLASGGIVFMLRSGWYDVGAIDQHWQPTYSLLELALRYSVRHQAREVATPPLTASMAQRGAQVYARHCVQCHGAPGVAPEMAALALQPSPGPLMHMGRRWQPNELYWLVSNGVKMTGMPAWRFRLSEPDIWAVVAFIGELPKLSPAQGKQLLAEAGSAGAAPSPSAEPDSRIPDMERGRVAMTQYACRACHVIPGVPGAAVDVGPPLKDLARQGYIAGYLPTTEENMVRWLRAPDRVKPGTAMPDLQVTERDARDMARWLLAPRR